MTREQILLLYGAFIFLSSVITFFIYGADKKRAVNGVRRVPEKILFSWCFLGGALGGLLGMKIFRHKTKHYQFWFFNSLFFILHCVLAVLIAFVFKI